MHALQVAKNIALAGVGSLLLLESTPCSPDAAPCNFLIPADFMASQRYAFGLSRPSCLSSSYQQSITKGLRMPWLWDLLLACTTLHKANILCWCEALLGGSGSLGARHIPPARLTYDARAEDAAMHAMPAREGLQGDLHVCAAVWLKQALRRSGR